jgi:transcriptional regulator with XRE-family HTH domain
MADFGQELRRVRAENAWTLQDLERLTGRGGAAGYYSRVERGRQAIGDDAIDTLVRSLRGHASDEQLRRLLRAAGRPDALPEDARQRLERVLADPALPAENARAVEAMLGPLLALLATGPLPPGLVENLSGGVIAAVRLAEMAVERRTA